ncbi:hypothetical protein T484DRAFT_1563245, partial [Baffinella frigidus]
CAPCPPGFLKDVVGDAACRPCTSGQTAPECGCAADSFFDATSSLCVACPEGKISPVGATSASECYCAAGVFTN